MSGGATGLSQEEAFARIRLLRSPNVGPVSYFQLLRRFGTAQAAVEALPSLAARGGGRYRPVAEEAVEREIAALRRAGGRYLFHDSPDYPPLLAELDNPPSILTVRGNSALLRKPCVAIVGARNASAGAVKLARDFGAALAGAGQVVVSGLARGIDAGAHRGALSAGGEHGATIGVIASGIDVIYPPEHFDLQEEVSRTGLLVAEQPPGTLPIARHFPFRNRIIAGLCTGTLVVEAAPRSGSLITARLAGEAGREVMAIPGSPLDSRSQGCNQLIRDGAVLVQSPDDVLELLQSFTGAPRLRLREGAAAVYELPADELAGDEEEAEGAGNIANLLGTAPVAVDELIRQSGQRPAAVHLALLELELAGRLCRHAAGRVSLSA